MWLEMRGLPDEGACRSLDLSHVIRESLIEMTDQSLNSSGYTWRWRVG